jgi:hypothetical protein
MPVMGDVKLSTVQGVRLETDLEKMYQKDQEKQRVVMDPTKSKLDASTLEKVDEQLVRDDWLQDKWDDKKIIETA